MMEKVQFKITDVASEGYGLGYVDNKVTFVPFTAPGDEILAEIVKKKKNFNEARLLEVLVPSPQRVAARCSHFGLCGGCKWQHLTYEAQLFWKNKFTVDAIERIGKCVVDVKYPIVPSPKIFAYRNKMEFSFGWDNEKGSPVLGFHFPGRFDKVFHVESCYLQESLHNDIRHAFYEQAVRLQLSVYDRKTHKGFLRNLLIRKNRRDEWMVILVISEQDREIIEKLFSPIVPLFPQVVSWYYVVNQKKNDSIYDLSPVLYAGQPFLEEKILHIHFKISPLSFFQVNPDQAEQLYAYVVEEGEFSPDDVVYDVYTGTGTIALAIAPKVKRVVGIDNAYQSIEDARENALNNHISNAIFIHADAVKAFNTQTFKKYGFPDVVILDPPRSGLHPSIVKQFLTYSPRKIIYISCNPATQARDIGMLAESYKIKSIQPFDMFPQTAHVENVSVLVKK